MEFNFATTNDPLFLTKYIGARLIPFTIGVTALLKRPLCRVFLVIITRIAGQQHNAVAPRSDITLTRARIDLTWPGLLGDLRRDNCGYAPNIVCRWHDQRGCSLRHRHISTAGNQSETIILAGCLSRRRLLLFFPPTPLGDLPLPRINSGTILAACFTTDGPFPFSSLRRNSAHTARVHHAKPCGCLPKSSAARFLFSRYPGPAGSRVRPRKWHSSHSAVSPLLPRRGALIFITTFFSFACSALRAPPRRTTIITPRRNYNDI